MPVAIRINSTMPLLPKPHGYPLLWVQLHQIHRIRCHVSDKRNIMPLLHRMTDRHVMLMIHRLDTDPMVVFPIFSLRLWQNNPATGKNPMSHRRNDIPADWTDIKTHLSHIRRLIPVLPQLSCQQFRNRNVQRPCQFLNNPDIGKPFPRFP